MPDTDTPRWLRIFRDDGTGLAIIGVLSILRGVSYLPIVVNTERSPAHALENLFHVTAWAWVWLLIGGVCLAAILVRRLMPLAVGTSIGLHAAWALSFLGGWLFADSSRGWLSSLGYIGIAFLFLWAISRGQRAEVNLHFHDDAER